MTISSAIDPRTRTATTLTASGVNRQPISIQRPGTMRMEAWEAGRFAYGPVPRGFHWGLPTCGIQLSPMPHSERGDGRSTSVASSNSWGLSPALLPR